MNVQILPRRCGIASEQIHTLGMRELLDSVVEPIELFDLEIHGNCDGNVGIERSAPHGRDIREADRQRLVPELEEGHVVA